jgi:hypothetical protein
VRSAALLVSRELYFLDWAAGQALARWLWMTPTNSLASAYEPASVHLRGLARNTGEKEDIAFS